MATPGTRQENTIRVSGPSNRFSSARNTPTYGALKRSTFGSSNFCVSSFFISLVLDVRILFLIPTLRTDAFPPITWTSRLVRYSDNDYLFRGRSHNDVVWKAFEDEPFGSFNTRRTRHVCEGDDFVFEKINSAVNCFPEFLPKSAVFLFVPECRFNCLLGGFLKDSYTTHYPLPIRACILRRNSFRSISDHPTPRFTSSD